VPPPAAIAATSATTAHRARGEWGARGASPVGAPGAVAFLCKRSAFANDA
jgi:hypothetical protein